MGGCVTCVKYILFVFNFALWLLGCALLSVGIWMKMDDRAEHHVQDLTEKVDDQYQISYSATGDKDLTVTIAYLFIVVGLIVIVVTFIGCCGAVRENTCLLGVFAICLSVITIALLVVGIWAAVKKGEVDTHTDELRKTTDDRVNIAVSLYHSDKSSKEFMDVVQERFTCCGGTNAERDYASRTKAPPCNPHNYGRRCTERYFRFVADEIEDFMKKRYTIISAVALFVSACLALGVVVTVLQCCFIKRSSSVRVS